MLIRASLLFILVAAATALAISLTVSLPEIPLLRYVVLAAPLVGAAVVVMAWYELGAPSPRSSVRLRTGTDSRARIVQGRPSSAP